MRQGYDIIGDIHGYADSLTALLQRLEYEKTSGVWRHPTRKAIFLGDFVDMGPKQVETKEDQAVVYEQGLYAD